MIARIKAFLRRRKCAKLRDELVYIRASRVLSVQHEFKIRAELAIAEAAL